MCSRLLCLVLALGACAFVLPDAAEAHDDPVVSVRVMCDGFNILDLDQVLGEIDDNATLKVDRPVQGADQIQAWVQDQFNNDLRIEIVDMGTPTQLADGYRLTWTARLSRQDWRKAGMEFRQATNNVEMHNGRITNWTAVFSSGASDDGPAIPAPAADASIVVQPDAADASGIPQVAGIPVTLLLAGLLAVGGVGVLARSVLRR